MYVMSNGTEITIELIKPNLSFFEMLPRAIVPANTIIINAKSRSNGHEFS